MTARSSERLALTGAWTETTFERSRVGPGDRPGVAARFDLDGGDANLRVLPVRYECDAGAESLEALTAPLSVSWRETATYTPDVPETTAFAVAADVAALTPEYRRIVCVTRDPGDAVAVAVWLADGAERDRDVTRRVLAHRGEQYAAGDVVVGDDDVLRRTFADRPERCLLTGAPTRSHVVDLPYRYVAALPEPPRSDRGVLRFPNRVGRLRAAISHGAWTDRDLDAVAFDAPLERTGPGEYRLDASVAALVADGTAGRLAHEHPGEA